MADGDVYQTTWVTEANGVAMSNGMRFRANQDAAPGLEFNTLLDMLELQLLTPLADAISAESTITCLTARRITGVASATFTRFTNLPGQVAGDSLPTTSYLKLGYYGRPYQRRTSYQLRLGSITEVDHANGVVSLGAILRFEPFINAALSDPITQGGGIYRWVSPQFYPPLSPPELDIVKANIRPRIFNLRSRQSRLCGA